MRMMDKDLCPKCGVVLNAATDVVRGNHKPKPDDVSVCAYCKTFLKYDAKLMLVLLPEWEFEELSELTKTQLQVARSYLEKANLPAQGNVLKVQA